MTTLAITPTYNLPTSNCKDSKGPSYGHWHFSTWSRFLPVTSLEACLGRCSLGESISEVYETCLKLCVVLKLVGPFTADCMATSRPTDHATRILQYTEKLTYAPPKILMKCQLQRLCCRQQKDQLVPSHYDISKGHETRRSHRASGRMMRYGFNGDYADCKLEKEYLPLMMRKSHISAFVFVAAGPGMAGYLRGLRRGLKGCCVESGRRSRGKRR